MNGLPPAQKQHERTSQQWLAFKDGLRGEGKKERPRKGGKRSGEIRAEWHDKARTDALAMLRDGTTRSKIVATLATRYKRSKETVRDVLREVLPPPR
jgi:hypothetical protein